MKILQLSVIVSSIFILACSDQQPEMETPGASTGIVTDSVPTITTTPISCLSLLRQNFNNTSITGAENIASGEFNPPAGSFPGAGPDYSQLPAFCRITGSIRPTEDSDIRFEAWLPEQNWNGRFMQTGNGGVAGSIVHRSMVDPLIRGYAVVNTDTGHSSGGTDIYGWAIDHPEKITDFAWRAVHELTVTGKALTSYYYDRDPEKSYFVGCSTGGRQGLMEAQRFPEDYDAIIAGAPANNWSPLMALALVIQNNLGEGKLSLDKLGLLKTAAIASCDALDGVEDKVISSIAQCNFDLGSLQCDGEKTAQCLATEEVDAARTIYAGVVGADGTLWFPGTGFGSEQLWGGYSSPRFSLGAGYFTDIVLQDDNWDRTSFNVDEHMPLAMEIGAEIIAMDPDISDFLDRGGKLITYHGTYDGLIPYRNTLNYVNSVIESVGEVKFDEQVRYYQIPGMSHCAGGEGAHAVAWLDALETWVEEGESPEVLIGTHPAPPPGASGSDDTLEFTRPICPYPEVAVYNGEGDPALAENFSCEVQN